MQVRKIEKNKKNKTKKARCIMKEMVKIEGEKIVRVVKHGITETSPPQTPGNLVNTANSPQTSI